MADDIIQPEDVDAERDWFNDPPFLRSIILRTFELLPDDLDGAFLEDAPQDEVDLLMSHVHFVFAVDRSLREEDEEDEDEEELEDEEERPAIKNPSAS